MSSYQFFKQELELCTISSEGFRVLSCKILASLADNQVSFFSTFLKEISSLIISKQQTPISRFYALYLLFKASLDLKNEFLLELLKETALLTFVYHTAQYESSRKISLDERGSGFFGAAKSTSRVGINFVRLCLEMIIFWNQKYVSKKTPEHPSHMFHLYIKAISKKLKLPLFYYFIEKPYDLSHDLATWDFSLKLPTNLPAEETQSEFIEDQRDQEEDQFSCGSLPEDNTIFELKRSLSMQPQEVFSSSSPKEEEAEEGSDTNQIKQCILKEEIPTIAVVRHQSEPPHLMNPVTSFQNWQGLEEEDNVFSVGQRIPSSATLAKAKNPHFALGSLKNLAKSDVVCQKTKFLSDLDEIEMSIKRSMNSSSKTASTVDDNNNHTPEKCPGFIGIRLISPRPATVPPKNSPLASLRLASPQSVKNSKPTTADDENNNRPLDSSRKCFTFLKKDTIIPSYSSIWDKEETNLSSARTQRETTSFRPPLLKKSASIVPNSLADLELMLGRDSSQKEQPAYGKIEVVHRTTQSKRENLGTPEKKKYDPFARERLVEEPSHL